jgi:two-component system response regulator MprA
VYNADVVLTRDTLYDRVWGIDFETGSRSLDVHMTYLRAKTEAGDEPRVIETVRGVGYVVRR